MKFIRAEWHESRGDEHDHWGNSIWYLELDEENYPTRQIEVYSNGNRLKYHLEHLMDKYGQLSDQAVEDEDSWGTVISEVEFERNWKTKALNDG